MLLKTAYKEGKLQIVRTAMLVMLCFTLHNAEEAIWLIQWREKVMPNSRTPKKIHFIFAVSCITVLGYMAAVLFALYPDNMYIEYAFIGFVGAMIINAITPHLVLTIRYRKPCPGVFTGCILILPIHILILYNAVNTHIKISEVVISTIVVGALLLASIPLFISLAKRVILIDKPENS